jgi:ribosome maturation factor RimP
MDLVRLIRELARPVIERYDAYLVDCTIRGEGGTRVIEIFIDADQGVSTELCASISRDLSKQLDAGVSIPGRYRLEVSSPGLDRPLKLYRQYPKNIGRTLKVKYAAEGTTAVITGKLTTVAESSITLEVEKGSVIEIPMNGILRATIEPRFK